MGMAQGAIPVRRDWRKKRMVQCDICKSQFDGDSRNVPPIEGFAWFVGGYAVCKSHADEYMRKLIDGEMSKEQKHVAVGQ